MNQAMWHKAITQENLNTLRAHGVHIIAPESGEQACGDIGFGRMSEPATLCETLLSALQPSPPACLQDVRVLISAGPTREPLDPVRYLTNRSSGKMGYALAMAAVSAGAKVTLVSGKVNLTAPANTQLISVETAAEMYDAVLSNINAQDIYIGTAAVADYRPLMQAQKIKKHSEQLTLVLEKTSDILAAVAERGNVFTVGFAAETEQLENYARDKLARKKLDMIAANWVGREQGGFDSEHNALQVFWQNGQQTLAMTSKTQLAQQLIQLIAQHFDKKHAKNTT
jgi:phosphopantothenoylcysteine decarboxylase/phosphopantothenate--cysteine ligase